MTQSNNTHANGKGTDEDSKAWNLEQLLEGLFQALHRLWLQGRRVVYFIMSELGGNELFEAVISWSVQHPDLAICLLAACFVFLLPILIIFGFGFITLLITFTGILVLEGTLLTFVFMIFFACIGSLAIAFLVFAVVAYFGFSQIYRFLGIERYRDAFLRFLQENISAATADESN
ncbi:hypothetical protein AWZ03_011576 [Drosophila navojoa]|uniref:Uncharacterized protein n=1 Tax=Drosophila navojoa TaxID=7232 RepID=A0A484B187_DRONA|nr:uncharacterized protein LOC108657028 [Drosophila navojoa]TDG42002.1 hypothetical protein AWZ03_011576 [Drosophila navojoa]